MPRGGIRPRRIDGSTDHLLKPKWKSGATRTIRVPVALAEQLLDLAHRLDSGDSIVMTQDKSPAPHPSPDDLTQDLQLNLEVERERFLASLKVGRQAPEYKRTKAVLDRFLAFCPDTTQKMQA